MKIKGLLTALLMLIFCVGVNAQMAEPVKWKSSVKNVGENLYEVSFTATIDAPFHIYDMGPYQDGPNATTFTVKKTAAYQLVGNVTPTKKAPRHMDETFGMEIGTYDHSATFVQKVKVLTDKASELVASVEWQACDNQSCLPPTDFEFNVKLPAGTAAAAAQEATAKPTETATAAPAETETTETSVDTTATEVATVAADTTAQVMPEVTNETPEESKGLLGLVLEAIGWGLIMLLTPCVFPMIPMTVSFFLHGDENKAKGRFNAAMYGIFIVLLYTLPIAAIILATYFIGGEAVTADIFNWVATHWLPNVIFFLVFMIFAASFFGAFEIRMPSKLVNKSDSKSDKGGLAGVFFMALTLVLVSFSCTGPIVGTVIIKAITGGVWVPIITMFAFSVAFALPFAIFAFSPSLLKDLPKSGGWLNSVKVVLGFIELALGLKFLSVADQTYHWGILDREVYLAIWIAITFLLGLYLIGKIKFSHDSEMKYLGVGRLSLAIITFSFMAYLIPGMWGAPLKALSGYMPPLATQDYLLTAGGGSSAAGDNQAVAQKKVKYDEFLHFPPGLNLQEGFFDFHEGMARAKEVNKPVFIDFTGHGCVNCRNMEQKVWSDPRVRELLANEFVVIALYADDKNEVPESEWITTESGKVLKGLGRINSNFVKEHFQVNAQPYYFVLDHDSNYLVQPRGYNTDVDAYIKFLQDAVTAYKEKHSENQ